MNGTSASSSSRPTDSAGGWIFGPLRRCYDWVVSWAKTRHANTALFLIAFAESSFFPIAPDVLLIAMGVGAPKRSFRFAGICLVGSVLGGVLGYYIGMGVWALVSDFFFTYVPNFTPELFQKVSALYHENAVMALFAAGFTPIPYKVFTVAAGVTEISLPIFIATSVVSRGLRFFLVGSLLYVFGAKIQTYIDRYFNLLTIVFTVLLVGGFLAIKVL